MIYILIFIDFSNKKASVYSFLNLPDDVIQLMRACHGYYHGMSNDDKFYDEGSLELLSTYLEDKPRIYQDHKQVPYIKDINVKELFITGML